MAERLKPARPVVRQLTYMNIGISVHRARDGAQNQVCNKARLCNTAHACNMKFVHLHAHTRAITLGRMGARAGAAHVLTRAQHITRAHVLERINARANTLSHPAYVLTRAQRINARAQACSRAYAHMHQRTEGRAGRRTRSLRRPSRISS
jgi:hypothetical protein